MSSNLAILTAWPLVRMTEARISGPFRVLAYFNPLWPNLIFAVA
jgi:hypothetical protein